MHNVPLPPSQTSNTPNVGPGLAIGLYYLFKILPIVAGMLALLLGYRLFILGVTGQASLSVQSKDVSGQLLNAAPGLFFAVGGVVTIVIATWKGVKISFAPEENAVSKASRPPALFAFGDVAARGEHHTIHPEDAI